MTRPFTALLVDDDPRFGAALAPELAGRGVTLVQARSAREVEAALRGARPDVYVVDGLLPDGDGPGWIESLRKREARIPVAFVSPFWHDLGSLRRLREELGVALVARKPVVPAVLAEQIRSLLPAAADPDRRGSAFAMEIAALRRMYAAELPAEVASLSEALGDPSRAGVEYARLLAHRLHGTAGTYGFDRVSTLAAEVESALLAQLAPGAAPGPVPSTAALERAAAEAAEASAAPGTGSEPVPAVEASGRVLAVGLPAAFASGVAALASAAGIDLEVAPDWSEALRHAVCDPPEVAVLGPEGATRDQVLAVARELGAGGCTSVVLVGGGEGIEARVAAMRAGVSLTLGEGVEPDAVVANARELVKARLAERAGVLVVDDDPAFASHVCAILRAHGFRPEALTDPLGLLDRLHATRPGALLLDVAMPGVGGVDLCRMLRGMPEWQDLPILLVTAQADAATRLACYEAGADDHVAKPVLERELVARIGVRIERQRLLRERSDRDALTGVASRRAFLDALEARLSQSDRHGRKMSVVVLDLDHFKRVNDEHGHLVGDRVLSSLGGLLSRRLRREDLRCRWGGEEFALALAEADGEVAAAVVDHLLREFREIGFEGADGERFTATFSAGVASSPGDGVTIRSLFDVADRRCYAAKRSGRARVVAADPLIAAPP